MYIPKEFYLKDGENTPENTIIKKCTVCNCSFAIPSDKAQEITVDVCEDCKDTYEKQEAAKNVAEMKTTDAEDTIKAALGN